MKNNLLHLTLENALALVINPYHISAILDTPQVTIVLINGLHYTVRQSYNEIIDILEGS